MGSDADEFRLRTLIFCLVFFIVMSTGHTLALAVKAGQEKQAMEMSLEDPGLNDKVRAQIEANLDNATNIYFWDVLGGFGSIMFGLDLPMPWPLLVTTVNSVLLVTIAVLAWSFIKAHIPLISG